MRSTRIGVLAALILLGVTTAPVLAGEAPACNADKATIFAAAADRYRAGAQYVEAARWYLAATRYTHACESVGGALVNARSLAQAGTALAQSGDYLQALALLDSARSRLSTLAANAGPTAAAARSTVDLVDRAINAIHTLAQLSM